MSNAKTLGKIIELDPQKMTDNEYWNAACKNCKLGKMNSKYEVVREVDVMGEKTRLKRDIAEDCASCYVLLSEMKRGGEVFHLI